MRITKNEFDAYEGVRRYGAWNMFDPEPRAATGLEKDKYVAIISNYNALKDKFVKREEEEPWDSTYTD